MLTTDIDCFFMHVEREGGEKTIWERGGGGIKVHVRPAAKPDPTNNALLINFLLSSDAEIFVTKHRLSIQIGAKHAKNVHATCTCSVGASILHATVAGWDGKHGKLLVHHIVDPT